ncbi:MAG: LOG family protein [Anaerolineales bacterium]
MNITVFGGSSPLPGEPAYEQAYELGRLIGKAGFTVLTGGYIGTMEAVSRGVAETGGHVIGVTCDEIEAWRPVLPNEWIQEELRFATLKERMYTLIDKCDVALVLPGGIGTVAEFAVMWSQMQVQVIDPRPLIFIGPEWRNYMDHFFTNFGAYVPEKYRSLISFSPDIREAFQLLISRSESK